ncbi:MAG: class I SAM-dependent methyltransferase [Kiritimatiellae bacterium]|nr:class I SAM-dependent methyltransferase [Kiritimatiellia bacterium]MDD5521326.1 class I SAM-dependent methyltransferase [Kiritimatiellia bacterium]
MQVRNRIIRRHAISDTPKISILDVGCGSGHFLELLDVEHYDKYGAEINPQGVRLCREKGLTVYDHDIRVTDFGNKTFNVITLWHVLEHVSSPVPFLKKIKEIKKRDGVVVISVPNTDSMGFKLGKQWWFHMDAPRHLFLPNINSMKMLANSADLQIVDVICPRFEFPLDLFWSVKKSPALCVVYPLYPLFKLLSRETLIYVAI